MPESTPEPISLGEPEVVPTIVSPYRVSNNVLGQPVGQYFEMITKNDVEPERVMFAFESVRTRQKVAVELHPDGTIRFGSWDADGEWCELRLTEDPEAPEFDLASLEDALQIDTYTTS